MAACQDICAPHAGDMQPRVDSACPSSGAGCMHVRLLNKVGRVNARARNSKWKNRPYRVPEMRLDEGGRRGPRKSPKYYVVSIILFRTYTDARRPRGNEVVRQFPCEPQPGHSGVGWSNLSIRGRGPKSHTGVRSLTGFRVALWDKAPTRRSARLQSPPSTLSNQRFHHGDPPNAFDDERKRGSRESQSESGSEAARPGKAGSRPRARCSATSSA